MKCSYGISVDWFSPASRHSTDAKLTHRVHQDLRPSLSPGKALQHV